MLGILDFILGGILLFTGRKLFWLFVGGMGFALSLSLALQIFKGQSTLILVLGALIIGVIGALLTVFLQKAAVVLGGALAGAYLLAALVSGLHLSPQLSWLPYLVGGLIGGILVSVLFEWSLIVLSALVGALLVIGAVNLGPALKTLGVLVLFVVGVGAQAAVLRREARPESKSA